MKYTISYWENLSTGKRGYYLEDGEKEYFSTPEETKEEFFERLGVNSDEVENNYKYRKIIYR